MYKILAILGVIVSFMSSSVSEAKICFLPGMLAGDGCLGDATIAGDLCSGYTRTSPCPSGYEQSTCLNGGKTYYKCTCRSDAVTEGLGSKYICEKSYDSSCGCAPQDTVCNRDIYPYEGCIQYTGTTPSEDFCKSPKDGKIYYKSCDCSSSAYPYTCEETGLKEPSGTDYCKDMNGQIHYPFCLCEDNWTTSPCSERTDGCTELSQSVYNGLDTCYLCSAEKCTDSNQLNLDYYWCSATVSDCSALGYTQSDDENCDNYLYCPFDTSYKACFDNITVTKDRCYVANYDELKAVLGDFTSCPVITLAADINATSANTSLSVAAKQSIVGNAHSLEFTNQSLVINDASSLHNLSLIWSNLTDDGIVVNGNAELDTININATTLMSAENALIKINNGTLSFKSNNTLSHQGTEGNYDDSGTTILASTDDSTLLIETDAKLGISRKFAKNITVANIKDLQLNGSLVVKASSVDTVNVVELDTATGTGSLSINASDIDDGGIVTGLWAKKDMNISSIYVVQSNVKGEYITAVASNGDIQTFMINVQQNNIESQRDVIGVYGNIQIDKNTIVQQSNIVAQTLYGFRDGSVITQDDGAISQVLTGGVVDNVYAFNGGSLVINDGQFVVTQGLGSSSTGSASVGASFLNTNIAINDLGTLGIRLTAISPTYTMQNVYLQMAENSLLDTRTPWDSGPGGNTMVNISCDSERGAIWTINGTDWKSNGCGTQHINLKLDYSCWVAL